MIRSILPNKWIVGAISLLVIIAAGCFFYYQHVTEQDRQQAAKTADLLRQWESDTVKSKNTAETAKQKAPADSIKATVETLVDKSPTVTQKPEPTQAQSENASLAGNTETQDVPVSPYGFGPYPKVPDDYFHFNGEEPDPNFWTYDWDKNSELMTRVSLKLWEQGTPTYGGIMSNDIFYPNYPNTIIVKWTPKDTPFGTRRYASDIQGSPETASYLREMRGRAIYEDEIPPHITVLEYKDAGIDPYEFLDLPK